MNFLLTMSDIECAVSKAGEYLEKNSGKKADKTRILLWLEETLLTYRDKLGEAAGFALQFGRALGSSRIKLTVEGEMLDPFSCGEDSEQSSALMRSYLTSLEQRPAWRYAHARNTVVFNMPRLRLTTLQSLALSVAAAIVLGLLMRFSPEGLRSLIQTGVIQPAITTFMGFLNAVATPMIFLSVVWGIYSMGDTATFSRIGSRVCGRYIIVLTVLTVLLTMLTVPLLPIQSGSSVQLGGLDGIYKMVLDIVPDNLFTPFSSGNTLQILFVAVMIGITMIVISDKTQGVALISEQLNCIVQSIMSFVGRLVPFFIFGSLFNIICSSDLTPLAECSSFFFATIIACALLLAVHTVLVCVRLKIKPRLLWKKALPTFTIAFSTASSSAAFASNLSTATDKFGISDKLANFGVPVGQVMYKPGVSAVYLCAAVCTAHSFGIQVSPVWFVSAALMCILLSLATPTIPGGTAASFAVLFAQLGLPTEQLAVLLALNTVLDFFHTAANIFGDQCVLLLVADKFDMIDREVLLSESSESAASNFKA